jgi:hypothetical protein
MARDSARGASVRTFVLGRAPARTLEGRLLRPFGRLVWTRSNRAAVARAMAGRCDKPPSPIATNGGPAAPQRHDIWGPYSRLKEKPRGAGQVERSVPCGRDRKLAHSVPAVYTAGARGPDSTGQAESEPGIVVSSEITRVLKFGPLPHFPSSTMVTKKFC